MVMLMMMATHVDGPNVKNDRQSKAKNLKPNTSAVQFRMMLWLALLPLVAAFDETCMLQQRSVTGLPLDSRTSCLISHAYISSAHTHVHMCLGVCQV